MLYGYQAELDSGKVSVLKCVQSTSILFSKTLKSGVTLMWMKIMVKPSSMYNHVSSILCKTLDAFLFPKKGHHILVTPKYKLCSKMELVRSIRRNMIHCLYNTDNPITIIRFWMFCMVPKTDIIFLSVLNKSK